MVPIQIYDSQVLTIYVYSIHNNPLVFILPYIESFAVIDKTRVQDLFISNILSDNNLNMKIAFFVQQFFTKSH